MRTIAAVIYVCVDIFLFTSMPIAFGQSSSNPTNIFSDHAGKELESSASATSFNPLVAPQEGRTLWKVHMPDGQLKSHSIRVYVTPDIPHNQRPRLRLLRSHAVTKHAVDETSDEEPALIATSQEWIEVVEGQRVRRSGTLLIFDIDHIEFEYNAMLRVTPVVSWGEKPNEQIIVGEREVNVGNVVATVAWTTLVVGSAILMVIMLTRQMGRNPLLLLTGVDGHLSLAQTQIACWTVALGSVVLGYGFIKLGKV